jgi:hypothetical protein
VLAHDLLDRRERSPQLARRARYPSISAMIGHTSLSLWLLAQHLTKRVRSRQRRAHRCSSTTPPASRWPQPALEYEYRRGALGVGGRGTATRFKRSTEPSL